MFSVLAWVLKLKFHGRRTSCRQQRVHCDALVASSQVRVFQWIVRLLICHVAFFSKMHLVALRAKIDALSKQV